MSTIKGLRILVRLKKRRVEQGEAALQESARQRDSDQAAHEAAVSEEQQVQQAEQAVRDRLGATTTRPQGFHAQEVVTLQMLVKEAEGQTTDAAKKTRRAAEQVEAALQRVAEREFALRRATQQLEGTELRLEKAIQDAERAQEDAQDEEAEETAVARMLAGTRAAARSRLQLAGGAKA
ncbi:type III secretion protein [Acidovorax sp. SUPP3334]|uniref:type III secretion protein n=1 Tax=Acidovorax sp. SUPP3334 TaxID=2920881 RepID=UPI0023DE649F|nr:type III secretion protein [Acidovorax sp. SUPP3334]GKT20950.1 type III secretion protein [Acidovorax sp. SUPP3334]